ncbi:ATP-grasp domain-containing protein [Eubacteriaceae bacterium ES3]|nr:ATP-grasp domain-containing protein [Eubacteriaceae bacterium ES3]
MKGWLLRNPQKMEDPSIVKIMKVVKERNIDLELVNPLDIQVVCEDSPDGMVYVGDEKKMVPDYVIAAFFNEKNYHAQSVLVMLESLGVFCINNWECIQSVDDKLLVYQKVVKEIAGVKFPKTVLVTDKTTPEFISSQFDYPVVMKVMHGSKGLGVVLVNSEKECDTLMNMTMAGKCADEIIIQECIMTSSGRDIRIVLIDGEFETAFIRQNDESFRSNIAKGGKKVEFNPPAELIETAEKVAKLMGIAVGTVDFLFGEEGNFYLCEANAMPGVAFDVESVFKKIVKAVAQRPVPVWKEAK